ncbi:MAG: kynureninase [Bacteroidota bacterium]|nr:kynureninase [Bacteroidota bacterium]
MKFKNDNTFAKELDDLDQLKHYREKFYIPKNKNGEDVIYLAGNSLGLQPKSVRDYVEQEILDWERIALAGHTEAKNPWLPYHEFLTEQTARLVGAKTDEVVNMNSLTTNLHLLFVSFYRPTKQRHKILIEANAFPSDHYAVQSQIKFHGYDVENSLIEMKPREGEDTIRTDDIEAMIEKDGDSIALVWFAGVNYYSGQAFDFERLVKAGHKKNIIVGFDLAHAVGNLELKLHDWNVDFAVWCNYKYMNGGPGAIGGAYVHDNLLPARTGGNDDSIPKFLGWWGHDKQTRFLMDHKYIPIPTVESWQLSNPPILQLASLKASLDIFDEVGMKALREKSEKLTDYLEFLIIESKNNKIKIITPSDKNERGCQLSLRIKSNGKDLYKKLMESGVVCDWREPDVIRVAPVPLYNTFEDVYNFSKILFSENV